MKNQTTSVTLCRTETETDSVFSHLSPAEQELRKSIAIDAVAKNTLLAYLKDVRYFWAWYEASHGKLPKDGYPVDVKAVYRFILEHKDGLPPDVDKALYEKQPGQKVAFKAAPGTHKLSTIRRRVAALSRIHIANNCISNNPCRHPEILSLLEDARKGLAKKAQGQSQSKTAAPEDVVVQMINACDQSMQQSLQNNDRHAQLRALRDKAAIWLAYASGGRRRNEVANVNIEHLTPHPLGFTLSLPTHKTDQKGKGSTVPVFDQAATAVKSWLEASGISEGALFRGIDRKGRFTERMTDKTFYNIIKKRAKEAGFTAELFGAHSLRSGFITECGRRGIPLQEAMKLSLHKDVNTANKYHQAGDLSINPAARLASK